MMKKSQPLEFKKTATFYTPIESKPDRFIKISEKMIDSNLKVQGRRIV